MNPEWQQVPRLEQAAGAVRVDYSAAPVHTDTPEVFLGAGPERQAQELDAKANMAVGSCWSSMGAEHLRRIRSHATRRCLWPGPGPVRVRARTVGHSYRHRRRAARLYSMVEAIQRESVLVHRRPEQFMFMFMLTYRQWRRGMDRVYLLVEPHPPRPWVVPRGR